MGYSPRGRKESDTTSLSLSLSLSQAAIINKPQVTKTRNLFFSHKVSLEGGPGSYNVKIQ